MTRTTIDRAAASARRGDRERILVAVDFSEGSVAAATWIAQHFARGAEVVLVHVLHVPPLPRFLEGRYPSNDRLVESARAGAEARLRELAASVATGLVWPEVRVGTPDEEIVRTATEYGAELVVVGRPGGRTGVWARIGTTAQRVLRRSTVPVLLASGMPAREPSRVLVAVDESGMTGVVLDTGARMAQRFSADATALHVLSVPMFTGSVAAAVGITGSEYSWPRPGDEQDQQAVRDAEQWLDERVRGLPDDGRMTAVVVSAPLLPSEAIIEEANRRGAELVVVGSSGAGAVPRLVFGSVAEGVLRGAPCPVLMVVPPSAEDRHESPHDIGG
jgi:nucleotide-binding universal stress UspA family protein